MSAPAVEPLEVGVRRDTVAPAAPRGNDSAVPHGSEDRLRAYLTALSRERLVARLLALAETDEVAMTALRVEAEAASGEFDLAAFRKELTQRLRVSGYVDWRGAGGYANRAHRLLDTLDALIEAGRAADVVVLAEHVMARLGTAMGHIDDSSGHMGGLLDRVADIHLAACLAARPEPKRLAARLVDLALRDGWEWLLDAPLRYADVLGEEGLAAYRARLEREWEAIPQLLPSSTSIYTSYDRHRFTVTEMRANLARANRDTDDLVSVMARDQSSPYQFCRIAEELERAAREREALAWLERGLQAFPPAADARLRSRLTAAYLRDGQRGDAIALAERAFANKPQASTYGELREAASGSPDWPERRQAALRQLRQSAHRDDAVAAQLDEGALDAAWADAVESGCRDDLWRRLADARRNTHPDESIAVYRGLIDRLLERSDVRAYREAVTLLGEIRAALAAAGREPEFAQEVERIRAANRRRPRLIGLLAEEGW